jgi:carbamoyl-phosphate synthase large subunit
VVPRPDLEIVEIEDELPLQYDKLDAMPDDEVLRKAKQQGFSDRQLATALSGSRTDQDSASAARRKSWASCRPTSWSTPAPPSSRPTRPTSTRPTKKIETVERDADQATGPSKKIMILGGGPNRIGQGIEFDYCCVHASFALRAGLRVDHGQLEPGDGRPTTTPATCCSSSR